MELPLKKIFGLDFKHLCPYNEKNGTNTAEKTGGFEPYYTEKRL